MAWSLEKKIQDDVTITMRWEHQRTTNARCGFDLIPGRQRLRLKKIPHYVKYSREKNVNYYELVPNLHKVTRNFHSIYILAFF